MRRLANRFALASLVALVASGFQWKAEHADRFKSVLDNISTDSLETNLKFISSDDLEGRGTPSAGLNTAARYIADHFRAAGLEPAGADGGYFQKTVWPPTGERSAPTQNVIGILPGSDPKLKDTYVLVTAHYDHLGKDPKLQGDQIFNGANDDGSGTVSVMELAKALGTMKQRPKRTIVFMTFFGEELGLRGSRYYGAHPVFPLDHTVAQINLEQIGRVDDDGLDMTGRANITGFDFSDVSKLIQMEGKEVGLNVYKNEELSDPYFAASDNQSLADVGIPSHTISVGYEFPDYHRVSDTWDKIDYRNMALVDRAVALTLISLANSEVAPKWNEADPKTARYVQAWKKLHPG
jgi:Zn-dependent M28 family amino/carboxypeptidase